MGAETGPDRWVLCVITAAGQGVSAPAARVAGMLEPGWANPGELPAGVVGRWAVHLPATGRGTICL